MRVIGLDMDGVIVDHSATIVALAAEYGILLEPEQTTTEEFGKYVAPEIETVLKTRLYTDETLAGKATLMPGARKALEKMASHQKVVVLSRRTTETGRLILRQTGLWGSLFDESNAFFVEKSDEKLALAQELGVTHYVDDQIRALKVRMVVVPHKYLFDQFDQLADDEAYVRITSWQNLALELANGA